MVVRESLAPVLAGAGGAAIDTLLLGCTHYPLLGPAIDRVAGDGIAVIDSAHGDGTALGGCSRSTGLRRPPTTSPSTAAHDR